MIVLFSQTSRPARSQLLFRAVSPGIKQLWRAADPSLPFCVEIRMSRVRGPHALPRRL